MDIFKQLTSRWPSHKIWSDFVTLFACAISNAVDASHFQEREQQYLQIIQKYSKQEKALFPQLAAATVLELEKNPNQDFLGKMFMALELANRKSGQVFTPYSVCELMAKMSLGDVTSQVQQKGYITVCDHCCGAGALLIAGLNEVKHQLQKQGMNFQNHILIAAQDIDPMVSKMCYIQLSLLGAAGFVKVGNALTEPICANDTTEHYWFTPMYFSTAWATRRLIRQIDCLFNGTEDAS